MDDMEPTAEDVAEYINTAGGIDNPIYKRMEAREMTRKERKALPDKYRCEKCGTTWKAGQDDGRWEHGVLSMSTLGMNLCDGRVTEIIVSAR